MCNKTKLLGVVWVVLWAGVGCLGSQDGPEYLQKTSRMDQNVLHVLASPVLDPRGLTWAKDRLWVIDGKSRLLARVHPESGKMEHTWELSIAGPTAVAWDGSFLRILDAEKQVVYRFDPENGKILDFIQAPRPDIESKWSYGGMAVVDSDLYIAVSAGWCSKIYCMDLETGKIRKDFFPQCDPRGLASDGSRLWILAYNTSKLPAKLNVRDVNQTSKHRFVQDLWVADPTDMVMGDNGLWIVDRQSGRILQLQAQ